LPPEAHPIASLELLKKKDARTAHVGLNQAINDCIEMSIRFDPAGVRKLDIELYALGIVTLSEVRRQYDKRFARSKDRGKIRNETEYYLVRNVLLDRMEKTAEEQSLLAKMIDDYESSQVRRPPHLASPPSGGEEHESVALEQRNDLGEGLVGDGFDLGLGAILDRMRYVDDGGLEAQRIALRGDTLGELGRDDIDAGEAAAIEIVEVVQTARCAGPSIA
jgi:hypothetical protein